ncbi:class I SAM-dependent methyltransferase [Streptomyces sp. SL13]|uniref:Class I SAM-dependent methyltransferase n=1 Tax=Streptantibioticus silvisoli TaxID=2705255 RepID=A0AA90H773_9ACTN|nr:class I SAM-dependent methyltransferase [Streptantibioticus silvisoli]MDI5963967.1 class I SAM-dependent methyltransferase [Streptantibioticus silvisoli]MDI5970070.1 class I SAM-dependent methyltransferase [Streptantibioticus silvisoli]
MDRPDLRDAWAGGGPRSVDRNVLAERGAPEKPYFAAVAAVAGASIAGRPGARVLDIGCSAGAFVAYLSRERPNLRCTGVDLLAPVVEAARANVPGADFAVADLLDAATLPTGFDVTTMLGIHSLFDDPGCWIEPALSTLRPGGRLVAFGLFNDEPVDVLVRMRDSRPDASGDWQTGWTTWSKRTVEQHLLRSGLSWTWHAYALDRRVERWSPDPLHSWTVDVDGEAATVNGGRLLHSHAILEVTAP